MIPVTYSFCSSKKYSASTLNTLKKWFPNVKVEEFPEQNTWAVVLEMGKYRSRGKTGYP